jgi:hypothetical protein
MRHSQRGNTLAATLVVVLLMMMLAVALMFGSGMFAKPGTQKSGRADGLGKTVPGAVKYAAKDDVCRSNLSQVRSALQIVAMANEDQFPTDLKETKLPAEFYFCPVGKETYTYDPATGQVNCPHLGHEKY